MSAPVIIYTDGACKGNPGPGGWGALLQYNGNLDTPMVFAVIVLLSLIGLAIYYAVEIAERFTIEKMVTRTLDVYRQLCP